MKDGEKRRRLQILRNTEICYSPVYCCAMALVPGSKEDKVSAKVQAACYSKSEKKNRSLFLSENVRKLNTFVQRSLFARNANSKGQFTLRLTCLSVV